MSGQHANTVNDTVSALLQCKFRADTGQVAYALKLSSAAAVAGALGWALSGNGSWAALTISMARITCFLYYFPFSCGRGWCVC